jgi:hypothetical protein
MAIDLLKLDTTLIETEELTAPMYPPYFYPLNHLRRSKDIPHIRFVLATVVG